MLGCDYKLEQMNSENDLIREHNEKVTKIRNNSFENNLTEIKKYYSDIHGELIEPYSIEEINKLSYFNKLPQDLYLYLTNVSRKIYTLDGHIITELNDEDWEDDEIENEDKKIHNERQLVRKTQLKISSKQDEYDNCYSHYLSFDDNKISEISDSYDTLPYIIFDSFTEYIYDNMRLKLQKLYTMETYEAEIQAKMKIWAFSYNCLRIMSGLEGVNYDS